MTITLTINGIDGFTSGKWNLHANAKVIDDETLELNATGTNDFSFLEITVMKNTVYIVSQELEQYSIYSELLTSILGYGSGARTFNTGNNSKIRVYVSNFGKGTGKFIFKRPMLNLGSIQAPYEKKRGERMVVPVARKNLFTSADSFTKDANCIITNNVGVAVDGTITAIKLENTVKANGMWTINNNLKNKLTPSQQYTFSCYVRSDVPQMCTLEWGGLSFYNVTTQWKQVSRTAINFLTNSGLAIKPGDSNSIGSIYICNIQLEEGSTATPYEPYTVQLNPKPKKSISVVKRSTLTSKRLLLSKR